MVLAGRPKDLEDVETLWPLHGETVDEDRICGVLATLDEARGRSDLVRTCDGLR